MNRLDKVLQVNSTIITGSSPEKEGGREGEGEKERERLPTVLHYYHDNSSESLPPQIHHKSPEYA